MLKKNSKYELELSNYINEDKIENNIFGHELIQIAILNISDFSKNGISITSKKSGKELQINDTLDLDDFIIIKAINENNGVNFGDYFIEFGGVVSEPFTYEEANSFADEIYFFGNGTIYNTNITNNTNITIDKNNTNDTSDEDISKNARNINKENNTNITNNANSTDANITNNNTDNETFDNFSLNYSPNKLIGRHSIFEFTIESCYETCLKCNNILGFEINHHCASCDKNYYPFNYNNGKKCLKSCNDSGILLYTDVHNEECYDSCLENNDKSAIFTFEYSCIQICPEGYEGDDKKICQKIGCPDYYFYDGNNEQICISFEQCQKDFEFVFFDKECRKFGVKYNGTFYEKCPDDTCLSLNITTLDTCIKKGKNVIEIGEYCLEYDNQVELLKNLSNNNDNKQVQINDGVTINVYSTDVDSSTITNINPNLTYIDLGECQYKINEYYNLPKTNKLYMLVLDVSQRTVSSTINNCEYKIYLENGTLIENVQEICGNYSISMSSLITDQELGKYSTALELVKNFGYDIYDSTDVFYHDSCSPAYINNNDITISDRRSDFYLINISICNDGCVYNRTDYENNRTICNCNQGGSSYENNTETLETEEDNGDFFSYIADKINYKVFKCYKIIGNKNLYFINNIGLYISGTFIIISIIDFIIFAICYRRRVNKILFNDISIIDENKNKKNDKEENKNNDSKTKNNNNDIGTKCGGNSPKSSDNLKNNKEDNNNNKLLNIKEKKENTIEINNPPPKKNEYNEEEIYEKAKEDFDVKSENKKINNIIKEKSDNENNIINIELKNNEEEKKDKSNEHTSLRLLPNRSIIQNLNLRKSRKNSLYLSKSFSLSHLIVINDQIDPSDYNNLPYTQALRIDKRQFWEIFYIIFLNKIDIIQIMVYRDEFQAIEILINVYIISLASDLFLNSLLYNDDVISQKYHSNGELDAITEWFLSALSNIISFFFMRLINKLTFYNEYFSLIRKEIKNKDELKKAAVLGYKIVRTKMFFFVIVSLCVHLLIFYYLSLFCAIFPKSQISFIKNFGIGILQSMMVSVCVAFIVAFCRRIGLSFRMKNLYETSKFIDNFL